MRILQVRDINQVAEQYASALAGRGHVATVYEPGLVGGFAPMPLKVAMMPRRIFGLRRVIGRLDQAHFDLAHIHWASYGVLGLASRIPFIIQCHGSDVRARLKIPFFQALLAPVFRHAGAVLCITPDLLAITRTLRPDALYFPGPVDVERFAPRPLRRARPWTIFLFARLDPEKGVEPAAQGIWNFVSAHPEVRVQVVEWGALSGEFRQRYRQRFDFMSRVAPEAVPELITEADVIVGQLSAGVLGLSELQAMSCARPVITSCCYANEYPTPPPICQAATAEAVTAQLQRLFQHPGEAETIGRRAREWVIAHHSPDVLATRLEALYRSLLPGRHAEYLV